ncbi:hypothetical protein OGAPHI_005012 [Ogataea philodendri]|uniref:Uncharacterized protein n=1 Tax=Ogataea philodendri TaxID=1378263 RepID=A0A9P8P252_9ASCO|nr:uncharacterized protein OGAPHI_005012 [Ogataea philodendri]KAH3663611.1 hypothetical protein OGAPHI_005012 [Ogataea philodendri]
MVTLSPPISFVSTTSTVPISSGIGAPSLASGVPPQTLEILLRSNLDGTFKTKIPYLSSCSSWASSPLLKPSISSALCNKTVPLVSVVEMSIGHVKMATLDVVVIFLRWDSGSLGKTIPLSTNELLSEAPMIFTTLMESTLNSLGLVFGITLLIASATKLLILSSFPYCFDAITGLIIFKSSCLE